VCTLTRAPKLVNDLFSLTNLIKYANLCSISLILTGWKDSTRYFLVLLLGFFLSGLIFSGFG